MSPTFLLSNMSAGHSIVSDLPEQRFVKSMSLINNFSLLNMFTGPAILYCLCKKPYDVILFPVIRLIDADNLIVKSLERIVH
jgi:hypothetical protein